MMTLAVIVIHSLTITQYILQLTEVMIMITVFNAAVMIFAILFVYLNIHVQK